MMRHLPLLTMDLRDYDVITTSTEKPTRYGIMYNLPLGVWFASNAGGVAWLKRGSRSVPIYVRDDQVPCGR